MNREAMLGALQSGPSVWDFIIIGGGATGLGCAIEASSRGYTTLLLEMADFAQGTSSRSTKLVHGGVRYLRQGNISLVLEALKERGVLIRNAPHIVRNLPFVVPNYSWWEGPFYGIGLKMYDMLAGRSGFGRSRLLTKERTLELLPNIASEGLDGGVIYYDGQFDDARLAINMAQTAAGQGAVLLNYMPVTGLLRQNDEVNGVRTMDLESGVSHEIPARVVINATGVFTDNIRRMDNPEAAPMVTPSQGIHIVLDRSFLAGDTAIMVPRTDDGRVLFAIPWHEVVVVGTTDTPVDEATAEPVPFAEELDFLLRHAARYLDRSPTPGDVRSAFAGLRPLVSGGNEEGTTAELARDHTLVISKAGLVTITGGKWTTYRKMAEDTIDQAATLADLDDRPSVTRDLPIHGYHAHPETFGDLWFYGSDAPDIRTIGDEDPTLSVPLHPAFKITGAQVIWAARNEMARTVEDVLARRTRSLLFDARASIDLAAPVASLLARELGRHEGWKQQQVEAYSRLAGLYMVDNLLNPPNPLYPSLT